MQYAVIYKKHQIRENNKKKIPTTLQKLLGIKTFYCIKSNFCIALLTNRYAIQVYIYHK